MIAAKIIAGRAYCGRCDNSKPFGDVVELGRDGSGMVFRVDLSGRWLWRPDLTPTRWRRGDHTRSYPSRHESERPQGPIHERLPTVIECPKCLAVQTLDK